MQCPDLSSRVFFTSTRVETYGVCAIQCVCDFITHVTMITLMYDICATRHVCGFVTRSLVCCVSDFVTHVMILMIFTCDDALR